MHLLYSIVTISYPSKLYRWGGTITFPVLIGSRGNGFGSKINQVYVQREKKRARVFFFSFQRGREHPRNRKVMTGLVGAIISDPLSLLRKGCQACTSPAHLLTSSFVWIWGCAVRSLDPIRASLPVSPPSLHLPYFLPLLLSRAPSVCHLLLEILKIRLPITQTRSGSHGAYTLMGRCWGGGRWGEDS